MRFIVLITAVLCSQSLWALPVVGEKVVYSGQSLKSDGLYDIERSMEIIAQDPATREYTVKMVYSQAGEGVPLGGYEQEVKVPVRQYVGIETSLIPMVKSDCGIVLFESDPLRRMVTSKDYLMTGMGSKAACMVEFPVVRNTKQIQWWSEEFAPWPVQIMEISLDDATSVLMTLKSHYKPEVVAPPAGEKPAEEKKPSLPIFEDPNIKP